MSQHTEFASRPYDQGAVMVNRPSGVACPACSTELVIGELEACQCAGCPSCSGLLFQQDVFAVLIQHLRATCSDQTMPPKPLDADQLRVRRHCPACQQPFETHAYGGPGNAVIDTCPRCQMIWLDRGELDKLVHAPGRRL